MSDAYDFLASFYQPISKFIFGHDLIYANQNFLEGNEGKKLLIIGGGDGMAYRNVGEKMNGEFWELSAKMTALAKTNLEGSQLKINLGAWRGSGKFDRVYLPFVLDTMLDSEIQALLSQIKRALNPSGEVIISDFFAPVTWRQKVVQKVMILFFMLFTRHRRMDLPDISGLFQSAGFSLIHENFWRKGWIRAQRWSLD